MRNELACTIDPAADTDGDGRACSLDCNEDDASIFVGAAEVCGNEVDEDCSGRFDDDDTCPDRVVDDNDATRPLLVCRVARTYPDAAANCSGQGMRLVSMRSAEDNEAVFARVQRRLGDQAWWIGLDDSAVEGRFDFSDGRSWSPPDTEPFTNWAGGEPNDSGGEDCGHIIGFISAWNDIPCGVSFASVCEPAN